MKIALILVFGIIISLFGKIYTLYHNRGRILILTRFFHKNNKYLFLLNLLSNKLPV